MKKAIYFFLTALTLSSLLGVLLKTPFAYAAGVAVAAIGWGKLKIGPFEKAKAVIPWLILAFVLPLLYALPLGSQKLNWIVLFPILFAAFFEEIGWRGFLFKELEKFGWIKMNLVIGLMWAAWHLPAILTGNYPIALPFGMGLFFFFINVILLSFLFGWFRQKTGGLFAPTLIHASHNFFVIGTLESSGRLSVALLLILLMLQAWHKPNNL